MSVCDGETVNKVAELGEINKSAAYSVLYGGLQNSDLHLNM